MTSYLSVLPIPPDYHIIADSDPDQRPSRMESPVVLDRLATRPMSTRQQAFFPELVSRQWALVTELEVA
jgi:hypothetical protein